MTEWQQFTERLVQPDVAIEDLEGWATTPEDLEQLEWLMALRDELQMALRNRYIPQRLRQRLAEEKRSRRENDLSAAPDDPRD